MAQPTRHDEIINIVNRRRQVSVQELRERLGVSEVTIRKDLSFLEEQGYLIRTHGGARLAEDLGRLQTISDRREVHAEEKHLIARAAASLINEGDTILIDAGSTCAALAHAVRDMNLRVITNSLDVMVELADSHSISLHSVGGSYRLDAGSFIGPAAEESLQQYRIDTCFIGTPAFTGGGIFSSQNTIESHFKRQALKISNRRIILSDHTKYDKTTFSVFSRAEDIDILVIDHSLEELEKLRDLGIEVLIADEIIL
ncbi:MAG TPA: DeoR/GlpR family DNA-binding transcription regulator [Clostridia bacterium]|nr:DeoR/GlpR family DNA-binding transcription regulator [Clostridia bacterium]